MITLLHILVLITFLGDMFLTYRYVKTYKKLYPKGDYIQAESNFILRLSMKYLGLGQGMFYGASIILLILIATIKLLSNNFLWFLLGMYFMANMYHFVNWQAMKRLIKNKNEHKKSTRTKRPRRN